MSTSDDRVAPRSRRAFTYRDVRVYRPFPGETPYHLVGAGADHDTVRIAKLDGEIIGAYRLVGVGSVRICIAALVVVEDCRGRGVGRWLLGHALGIAESGGGRLIDAPCGAPEFFLKAGFERCASGLRLRLTPE